MKKPGNHPEKGLDFMRQNSLLFALCSALMAFSSCTDSSAAPEVTFSSHALSAPANSVPGPCEDAPHARELMKMIQIYRNAVRKSSYQYMVKPGGNELFLEDVDRIMEVTGREFIDILTATGQEAASKAPDKPAGVPASCSATIQKILALIAQYQEFVRKNIGLHVALGKETDFETENKNRIRTAVSALLDILEAEKMDVLEEEVAKMDAMDAME